MNPKEIIERISLGNNHLVKNNCDHALMEIFRIKNLLLFSYKLLLQYETLTISICSQLNYSGYINQIYYLKVDLASINSQIRKKQEQINTIQISIKNLKNRLTEHNLLPSGKSKVNPLFLSFEYLNSTHFNKCDKLFIGDQEKSNYSNVEEHFQIKHKLPVTFYKEFLYLQMHFILLLVQGCHFVLPILSTRLSFLDRILYWPKLPSFGICSKSKLLNYNLSKIKSALINLLYDLINSINEIEKSVLFYESNQKLYKNQYDNISKKRHNLLMQLHNYNSKIENLELERNRLIGAVVKYSPNFNEEYPNIINSYTASLPKTSIKDIKNKFYTQHILSNDTNIKSSDLSIENIEHFENCPMNLNIRRSKSMPNEHLICHCINIKPSVEETKKTIFNSKFNGKNNNKINKYSSLKLKKYPKKSDSSIIDIKSLPQYRTINKEKLNNNNLLAQLSGNMEISPQSNLNKSSYHDTNEFLLIQKLLKSNDFNIYDGSMINKNIINEYLKNFNLRLQPSVNSKFTNQHIHNLPTAIYQSVDNEIQILSTKLNSESNTRTYHTITERNLYQSMKIFLKYSQI